MKVREVKQTLNTTEAESGQVGFEPGVAETQENPKPLNFFLQA